MKRWIFVLALLVIILLTLYIFTSKSEEPKNKKGTIQVNNIIVT